ncbi:cytochrome P450 family protein [Pseudobacillus badius]|uniref:cytochrome P450 family protein n=1 Tax=Bacillus badius TaxID=1455 RepID=UPI0007B0AA75|nr:cytochrome P450 [Bacillus badius]KZN98485.1 cytochrome P450 [Bacillus badius]MED0666141.1 cytochrome P450 [Bacillus badius]OCS83183.1 cytochrome P450 [Bacillus badius]OVE51559.1 cytochrome P450 [Bacillus badius]TDW02800.1 cytochrome P450 [Bacillus badius]
MNDSENNGGLALFTKEFAKNPYPAYEKLRETDPVYPITLPDGQRGWMITTYEAAVEALKDQRMIKDFSKLFGDQMGHRSVFTENMLFSDPPDHKRLRGLVQKAFTPKMIAGMRGRIQEITDELLEKAAERPHMNLIDDVAFPLPIIVICEMLGVPSADRDKFRIWSNSLIEGSNGENAERIYEHMNEFTGYLGDWFAKTQENPGDDLISQLIQAEEKGDQLTERELYGVVSLLIIAGHETTVNLIGNGMLSLLQHPDQFKKLQSHPELIQSAIEELLRFEGPVEFSTSRWAGEDFEFKGKAMKRGDIVIVALNSANHDPLQFENPDLLDITREKSPHLAFGTGIHHCLGAPLARMEGEIAISSLMRRFPAMKLSIDPAELEWRPGMIVRGVKEIPVSLYSS